MQQPNDSRDSHENDLDSAPESVLESVLEKAIDGLTCSGPSPAPAELQRYVCDLPASCRFLVIVELIKLDMSLHAEEGVFRRIEEYTAAMPDLLPVTSVPYDLVMEEIQLRKQIGQVPTYEDYQQRFPAFSPLLEHLPRQQEPSIGNRLTQPPPLFPAGSQLDDFLLLQQLGQGAFATVFLARQISMQRLVAVKISRRSGQEPQSLAQFDHPNIVRVYDQRSTNDGQLHMLYMQFHAGGTLADVIRGIQNCAMRPTGASLLESVDANLLRTSQAVPDASPNRNWLKNADWPSTVAWIGMQLASALQAAHEKRVLHRDIKPANVLLSGDGIPKLADFNVSSAAHLDANEVASTLGGSVAYMAPEHLRSLTGKAFVAEPVAEPADVYSLAVVLWELWQGRRPFRQPSADITWKEMVKEQHQLRCEPLIVLREPQGAAERLLEQVLRSALEVDPAARPTNAAEMAGQLRLALQPDAARYFQVQLDPFRARIFNAHPLLVATCVILLPNMLGGFLNYQYNYHQVMSTEMRNALQTLSWYVNGLFFPFGAACIFYFSLAVARAWRAARCKAPIDSDDIGAALDLGHRAAVVGGGLWCMSGWVIPLGLWWLGHQLSLQQSSHVLISSLVCGGIAVAYPFFGMTLIATAIYYPQFVRLAMHDLQFEKRQERTVHRSERYLLVAALVPLLGATLLVTKQSDSPSFMLAAIGAGALGTLIATFAHRTITRGWSIMDALLANKYSPHRI